MTWKPVRFRNISKGERNSSHWIINSFKYSVCSDKSTHLTHHQSTSLSDHTTSNTKHESEAENIRNRGIFVLWTRELMNQFLRNHQLNKAEIGETDESILDWIRVNYGEGNTGLYWNSLVLWCQFTAIQSLNK